MTHLTLKLENRRATRRLGAVLASASQPGDLLVLEGGLGAGKTFLVRGIARALGVPSRRPVTSPTFTLVNEHAARIPLVHADLYRLGDADDLVELGLSERIGGDALVIVEWGARFGAALGGQGVWLELELDAELRCAVIEPRGERGRAFFERIRAGLRASSLAFSSAE